MVKKAEVIADLNTLLESSPRTRMGKIWEIYDELLALRQSGVSVSDIEAKLNSMGFNLQPGNLTSYMYQIKKKKERLNQLSSPPSFALPNSGIAINQTKHKPKRGDKSKTTVDETSPTQAPAPALPALPEIEQPPGNEVGQTTLPKTGFHNVVDAIAKQNSGSDPRRND